MTSNASLNIVGSDDASELVVEVVRPAEMDVKPIATPEQVDNAVRYFAQLLVYLSRTSGDRNDELAIED